MGVKSQKIRVVKSLGDTQLTSSSEREELLKVFGDSHRATVRHKLHHARRYLEFPVYFFVPFAVR